MAQRFVSIQHGNVAKVIELILDLNAANKTEMATLQNEKDMASIQLASTMQQDIFEWVQNGHPSVGTHS
ncbi:hypothetical protein EN829_037995 [Mesorhizobium sp. M00.F.Ca.ET.186.01.1.1]|nr:hypothetical protein EN829_037995 [Mesorhizobium sp. M00.F.Ca.ET.186.01.1.1]